MPVSFHDIKLEECQDQRREREAVICLQIIGQYFIQINISILRKELDQLLILEQELFEFFF